MGFKPFQCDERGFILNYWLPKTKNTLPQPVSSFLGAPFPLIFISCFDQVLVVS